MAQQLIAINGNEEFPYTLSPNDITQAMGFPEGIAPGGFSASGIIVTGSGDIQLDDTAWNNAVQFNETTTAINLPTNNPIGGIIHIYPYVNNLTTGSFTLTVSGSGQFFNLPNAGYGSSTTSIKVSYTDTITILCRGNGEIDIIGGSFMLTNNLAANTFLGTNIVDPGRLSRSYFSRQNLLKNGSWAYGPLVGWNYSSSIENNITVSNNAPNLFLNINGPESETFTITSEKLALPSTGIGVSYELSGLIYNQNTDSSGNLVTGSEYDITVLLNFYNSSDTLLETVTMFTVPAGEFWSLYSNHYAIDSTTEGFSYATVTITGSTYPSDNNISFSQFKLEFGTNDNFPTLFSDETSILEYSKNSFNGSGYQKLPSGMIMQWGTASNTGQSGSTPGTAKFPVAFLNSCFQVVMSDLGNSANRYWTTSYTTTGFSLGAMETDASGAPTYIASGGATGSFIAFGW